MNHKLIVIDTNVLLSAALSPDGTARKALDKAYKEFKIAQSEETYQELNTRIYGSCVLSVLNLLKNKFETLAWLR
ncbi:MAG: hypothetical protein HEQ35_14430 [Gloeotrichia echinulata IR180]